MKLLTNVAPTLSKNFIKKKISDIGIFADDVIKFANDVIQFAAMGKKLRIFA